MHEVLTRRHRQQLLFTRNMLFLGGVIYLVWWFAVNALLPNSYNPLGSRLFVSACFFGTWAASFRSERLRKRLMTALTVCCSILTTHYFYLFHFNHIDINWVVGAYITVVAICATLQNPQALLAYTIYVLMLSVALISMDHVLMESIFLSGMITILLLANFGVRSHLKFMKQNEEVSVRVQSLFDAVFEGVVLHDNGYILEANQGFARIFQYDRGDLIGKPVIDFFAPDSRERVRAHLEAGNGLPGEATGLRQDGTLLELEFFGRRHLLQGKDVGVMAFHDITERKKAEKTRILYEATQEALRIRDEFISIASHELKTPLTSIKLQAQLTKRAFEKGDTALMNSERLARLADHMNRQADRLAHLVEDMLDISRISMGKFFMKEEHVDFSLLTQEVVALMSESFQQARCPLVVDIEIDVFVIGDPFRLEQVVMNLLSNALKYGNQKPVKLELYAHADAVELAVTDHGIGIGREHQDRIFQKFERAVSARNISGLGLGLFISKQITEAHNGEIRVTSELGQGARFSVRLPRVESEKTLDEKNIRRFATVVEPPNL